eukprot:11769397-Ditylum_brightwellii.AAC.1
MSGLEMYNKLLNVFQGQEHKEDKAVNAAAIFEKLWFTDDGDGRRRWQYFETISCAFTSKCISCKD